MSNWAPLQSAAPSGSDIPRGIWTGHQAGFWHPGILAKYLAADVYAFRTGRRAFNVVVDQDINDALTIQVPVKTGDELDVSLIRLGPSNPTVPTGMQPAIDANEVVDTLAQFVERNTGKLTVSLDTLVQAWAAIGSRSFDSLAAQVDAVTSHLITPLLSSPMPSVFASTLLSDKAGQAIIESMLTDAAGCVQLYNDAVSKNPGARLAKLTEERDRVELPVWLLEFNQPRQRVYVDLADTKPLLTRADGSVIDYEHLGQSNAQNLAPRALLLTALIRSLHSDLFIHGSGGWAYDRAMELWWNNWRQDKDDQPSESMAPTAPMAPMAMVSADIRLDFDVPIANSNELQRARWFAHALPHNIDRYTQIKPHEQQLAEQKRQLLTSMNDDRNPKRRAAAFKELHTINTQLTQSHQAELHDAQLIVARARAGVANHEITTRRDWPFVVYPHEMLQSLRDAIQSPK